MGKAGNKESAARRQGAGQTCRLSSMKKKGSNHRAPDESVFSDLLSQRCPLELPFTLEAENAVKRNEVTLPLTLSQRMTVAEKS